MQTFKLTFSIFIVFTMFFCFTFTPCFATTLNYIWSTSLETSSDTISDNYLDESEEETNSEILDDNFLELDCKSAILIEQNSGQILYSYNIHEKLYPASVTKVMSILLIMEALDSGKINISDEVPCSENASSMGGSQIWLDPRETLTVDEMLKAICVNSANDYKVQFRH